jgi:hypothetical protein
MAIGLFNRHARGGQTADDHVVDDESTVPNERAAVREREADADRALAQEAPTRAQRAAAADRAAVEDRTAADDRARAAATTRHPLVANRPPVPPGGAVAPPPDTRESVDARDDRAKADRDLAEAERERTDTPPEPARWTRTSFSATLSLILGVCAVLAALSGRLAPVAIVVGVVGLLFAGLGLSAVSRRHVTGHHVVLLGLVFSIVGIVFGILAINKVVPWLNGDADQVSQFRDWLNVHWSSVKAR